MRAAVPLADIVIIGPYDNGFTTTLPYNIAAHALARSLGVAWLDWFKVIDVYANANVGGVDGAGISFNLSDNNPAMRILSDGKVALGTASAFARLHVVPTFTALPALFLQGLTGQSGAEFLITDDNRVPKAAIFDNRLSLYNAADGDGYDAPTTYERLRVSPVSNVWTIASEAGGTGTVRALAITGAGVAIGAASPSSKAILDLTSTTKAFLPPRMTSTQRDAISSPVEGSVIYNLTTHKLNIYTGSAWEAVTSV